MNKISYLVIWVGVLSFCSFSNLNSATSGEKLDLGIDKVSESYGEAKAYVVEKYMDSKEKTEENYNKFKEKFKEKYNEALEKAKSK